MIVDLVPIPSALEPHHLKGRAVVVFDVLRATTTIATALSAGATEIRVCASLEAALAAGEAFTGPKLLCGERQCIAPPGFDLGNSPGEFTAARVSGKTLFMSTTNGTRAIVAAAGAERRLAAALVNASATARCLARMDLDVTLLCAGTDGQIAPEDLIGAGAVAGRLEGLKRVELRRATADARDLFRQSEHGLPAVLRNTAGGQNIVRAGLDPDIAFAARLDALDLAVEVCGDPPVARRIIDSCQPPPT